MGAAGIVTAALAFGGSAVTANTESWNGTNWTEVNNLTTARRQLAGAGASYTSVLAFGGETPGAAAVAITEKWNGTNWTEIADLGTARNHLAGTGTTSAGLAFGGLPITAATEEWNEPLGATQEFDLS